MSPATRPEPKVSLEEAYLRIRDWYQEHLDQAPQNAVALIKALPPAPSDLEMRAVMREVLRGVLEWAHQQSDGRYKMSEYAKAGVAPYPDESWLNSEEEAKLRASSTLWHFTKDGIEREGRKREFGANATPPGPAVEESEVVHVPPGIAETVRPKGPVSLSSTMIRRAFVSYSREDSEYVLRLVADLRMRGASLWIDNLDMRQDESWDQVREAELRNSSHLLVVLSPSSLQSKNILSEIRVAQQAGKGIILVQHREVTVPKWIADIGYIDLSRKDYESGVNLLLRTLVELGLVKEVDAYPSIFPDLTSKTGVTGSAAAAAPAPMTSDTAEQVSAAETAAPKPRPQEVGVLTVWDVSSGRELRTLAGHGGSSVYGLALSEDGRLAVSASGDHALKVWELGSGLELHTLMGHSDVVLSVALSADSRIAISASRDQTLKVWDLLSGGELRTFTGHAGSVYAVALSVDGRIAVSGSEDQTLKMWDLSSGHELRTLTGHTDEVLGVALSEDGETAVSASADMTVKVWQLGSGQALRTLTGHSDVVLGVAVSGNGRIAVSASRDTTLKVWDPSSGRELRTLLGHADGVHGVAVSRDGQLAVSISWDGTVRVWDLRTGHALRIVNADANVVHGVALSADGRLALSSVWSGTINAVPAAETVLSGTEPQTAVTLPQPTFDAPPTPKVVSDKWVTEDTLGYEAYARALAGLITNPETRPPLTIGIEAPWGSGKTSVMKMVQHALDADADLTEANKAGQRNRPAESSLLMRTLLAALTHPERLFTPRKRGESNSPTAPERTEFDTRVKPKISELGQRYGLEKARVTVWFNAWKYQSSEQVWAGLAHCIINHVTVRMTPRQRELFWLKLNSRRIDINAVRRKIYETVLQDLLPRLIGWGVGVVLLLLIFAAFALAGGERLIVALLTKMFHSMPQVTADWIAGFFKWAAPPAFTFAAALDLWRRATAAVNTKLREHAKGDLLKLVREPDYEGKMGFLYLVESDVREVLDLVATDEAPLVIFIDDLDRCVPNKVAEIVEAISLFLAGDYPNCIFVIAMEPHVVAAALEVANSDLIKRMGELGLSDTSAPMGWRFMEKIVQLPLVLPPPTKTGLGGYMNALAPDVEKAIAAEKSVSPPPDEAQVQQLVQELQSEPTLNDVVAKTERMFTNMADHEAPAIAEASKRVYSQKFNVHDPLVRKFLDEAVETFGANPRQIKRYINLFRLCCVIRFHMWADTERARRHPAVIGADPPPGVELPTDAEITKYVTFSVQWPQATSLLRRSSSSGSDGKITSLLRLLEQSAIELRTEDSETAAKWLSVVKELRLLQAESSGSGAWVRDAAFRRYLAKDPSLAAAADKGLW